MFLLEKEKIKQEHKETVKLIKQSISTHSEQIKFRSKNLQNYNFSIYNLNESMVVQNEIELL